MLSAKNASALRQMLKNAAHTEKPKKCGIICVVQNRFFPQGVIRGRRLLEGGVYWRAAFIFFGATMMITYNYWYIFNQDCQT